MCFLFHRELNVLHVLHPNGLVWDEHQIETRKHLPSQHTPNRCGFHACCDIPRSHTLPETFEAVAVWVGVCRGSHRWMQNHEWKHRNPWWPKIHGVHAMFATVLWKLFHGKRCSLLYYLKKAKSFEHTWKYLHRWKKLHHLTSRSAFVPTNLSGRGCLIHLNGWCSRLTWLVDQVDRDQGDHVPNLRKFWNAVAQRHREAFNKKNNNVRMRISTDIHWYWTLQKASLTVYNNNVSEETSWMKGSAMLWAVFELLKRGTCLFSPQWRNACGNAFAAWICAKWAQLCSSQV